MKLFSILLLIFYLSPLIRAQSKLSGYTIIHLNQPYTDLTEDSVLWENEFWVDSMYKSHGWIIPLKDKLYLPALNDSLAQLSYIVYSGNFGIKNPNYSLVTKNLNSFTREFSDTPPFQTKISYKEGTLNNVKYCAFQFKKIGITDSTYKTKGYINAQYWFYDGGDIEIKYGESVVPEYLEDVQRIKNGHFKPTIGVLQYVDTLQSHNMMLVGNYDSPRIYNGINKPFFDIMHDSALSQFPTSGTVYRFTTRKVGLNENMSQLKQEFIYPNPFVDELKLDIPSTGESFSVTLTDEIGRTIGNYYNQNVLKTSQLSSGVYFVNIKYESGKMATFKIIKANQ